MTKLVYHGKPTRIVHLALADGATLDDAFRKTRKTVFKLCDANSSELIYSCINDLPIRDGDTIEVPPFVLTQE